VSEESTWVHKFEVPWSKCSPQFLRDIADEKVPAARDMRQLISHTMSDVFNYSRTPTRDNLRAIGRKIVQRSPKSFADYINGAVVADGTNSIMLMLESKKENLNRRVNVSHHTNTASSEQSHSGAQSSECVAKKPKKAKPSKSVMSFGCKRWDVPPPCDETVQTMEEKQQQLKQLHASKESGVSLQVQTLMQKTFSCQRYAINAQLSISDVLKEWPYLGVTSTLIQHYKELTDIDIEIVLLAAVEKKASLIYEFCKTARSNTRVSDVLRDIESKVNSSGSRQPIRDGLLLLVMASMHEEVGNMIVFKVPLSESIYIKLPFCLCVCPSISGKTAGAISMKLCIGHGGRR